MNTITLKVRRPEGHIETVDISEKFAGMNDALFATIQKNTKAAGRGDVLSYHVEEPKMTAEDRDRIARINAEDALESAIRRNDAKAAVAARAKLEALGGAVPASRDEVDRDAVTRKLNLAD